ncbi:protein of unknown function [Trichlorobacter ammonificans]|uniref:Uncharacterized protein n=1 Tax=Trichlorobacter ammonificans TaxID=2916410 RepID=A0ABN8HGU5_9BACT|nr:protein of unknown function [Trichlorobacter ammonificans]
MLNCVEMRGAGPAAVESHAWNPGTWSLIVPPRINAAGPQQGAASMAGSAASVGRQEEVGGVGAQQAEEGGQQEGLVSVAMVLTILLQNATYSRGRCGWLRATFRA